MSSSATWDDDLFVDTKKWSSVENVDDIDVTPSSSLAPAPEEHEPFFVLENVDEVFSAVISSGLVANAQLRLLLDVGILRAFGVPFEQYAAPTDDGGVTVEFSNADNGREIVLAVPDDGSARYFIARDGGGVRAAGLISDDAGLISLGRWLAGAAEEIARRGLAVG